MLTEFACPLTSFKHKRIMVGYRLVLAFFMNFKLKKRIYIKFGNHELAFEEHRLWSKIELYEHTKPKKKESSKYNPYMLPRILRDQGSVSKIFEPEPKRA